MRHATKTPLLHPWASRTFSTKGQQSTDNFFEAADYKVYLSLLNEARDRFSCAIHAYVLMTNHVHILGTPSEQTSVSKMMQYVSKHYVPYINHKYSRSGTLWEGRFKAAIIATSAYLLSCYRYIELNPVRAGMVQHPLEYPWSRFRKNGLQRFKQRRARLIALTC